MREGTTEVARASVEVVEVVEVVDVVQVESLGGR